MLVTLGPSLVLSNVPEIRDRLRAALASSDAAVIDASALTDIDFAGLQLLCSAHRGAARLGRSLALAGRAKSPVIGQAILGLGFGRGSGCAEGCLCQELTRG